MYKDGDGGGGVTKILNHCKTHTELYYTVHTYAVNFPIIAFRVFFFWCLMQLDSWANQS